MKRLILIVFIFFSIQAIGQVGIGTTNPKAQLDIVKGADLNKNGILIPQLTLTEIAQLQSDITDGTLTAPQILDMAGLMFYVKDINGENELWHFNSSSTTLEPIYRKPKAFVKVVLLSQPDFFVNVDNHLEFDGELIDRGGNFTSAADASSATDPAIGGFVATKKGLYEIYAQYHTNLFAVSTGEYGISLFKTPMGGDFSEATNREQLSRTSYAFTANASALNKLFRSATTIVELNVGDRLDVFFNADSAPLGGGILDEDPIRTYMLVKLLVEDF